MSKSAKKSAAKPKRSLADEISDLINPTPKPIDPEDLDSHTSGLNANDIIRSDELESEGEDEFDMGNTSKLMAEKSSIRKNIDTAEDLGVAYRGKRISRAELSGDIINDTQNDRNPSDTEGSDGAVSEDENDDEDNNSIGEDSDGEQNNSIHNNNKRKLNNHIRTNGTVYDNMNGEDDDEEEADNNPDDENDIDNNDSEEHDDGEGPDEEMDSEEEGRNLVAQLGGESSDTLYLQSQLKMLKDEEQTLYSSSSTARTDELKKQIEKSQHIQPIGNIVNRFPVHNDREIYCRNDSGIKEGYRKAAKCTRHVLHDLFDLQSELYGQNSSTPKQPVWEKRKRRKTSDHNEGEETADSDIAHYWTHIQDSYHANKAWMDSCIEKWNKRVTINSGSNAMANKQFKVLNQSVLSQIATVLGDKERLVKRSQLKRTEYKIIGQESKQQSNNDHNDNNKDIDMKDAGKSKGMIDGHTEEYHEEIYDDADFYQQLLRDILASGDTTGVDRSAVESAEKARRRAKKTVDRRASKGRKVRYTVQPKLVNFMVPVVKHTDSFAADQLFMSLFGQQSQQHQSQQ